MYGWGKDCLILIPFRLPQTSCFTLSLKCFSSDSDNCTDVEIGSLPLPQFPHLPRVHPVLLTLLSSPLVPSSYQALRRSICSSPLLRYSCLLSAGVLHALLCLKMYSWCIRGNRCAPHPTTPPPSSPIMFLFILFLSSFCCFCFVCLLIEECHINIYSDYEIALSRIKVVRYKFKRHWEEIFWGLFRFIIHASSNPYFCYVETVDILLFWNNFCWIK